MPERARPGRHARRRRARASAVAAVAVAAVAGAFAVGTQPEGVASFAPVRPAERAVEPQAQPVPGQRTGPPVGAVAPGVPDRIRIPTLGVDAPVDPIAASGGTLRPPADPDRVGWWASGARPGGRRGAALLTGHSVSNGDGALDHLSDLRPDALVELHLEAGPRDEAKRLVSYRVESVTPYDREDLARHAGRLFATHGRPSLVLVTCIDFDGTSYQGNVVVVAHPETGPA